jgi:putative redox protein
MTKINVSYLGSLRTKSTHVQSGNEIITDAPLDNNGKGEAFSPTDLLATAYVNCMITIIGIYCEQRDITFNNCTAEVEKHMTDSPRRIGQLDINLYFEGNNWDDKLKKKIESAAVNCPVAKSISSDIKININFIYK